MKYWWIKIEDKYDWFEYFVFADTLDKAIDELKNEHEQEFEVLGSNANTFNPKRPALMIRQGCD